MMCSGDCVGKTWWAFVFACLLMILVSAVFSVGPVVAAPAERLPGVSVGSWIKYGGFLALWSSENPGQAVPSNLLDTNASLWVQNTVQSVSGSVLTFESRTRYKNGTEQSSVSEVDVSTGVGEGNLTFVSAGLSAGDRVYTAGDFYATRINATVSRAYSGLTRQTNLLNLTQTTTDIVNGTSSAVHNEFFWDKATGAMVEQFWSFASIDQSGYLSEASVEYKMIDNNTWLGPDVQDTLAPVANAGVDQVVDIGARVGFDGSASFDNVGIAECSWDFGDGSRGSGIVTSHVYARAGVFSVTVTVKDGKGNAASDSLVVTVRDVPGFSVPGPVVGVVILVAALFLVWLLLRRR